MAFKDTLRDHPALGLIDWVLRGIGQVVFQNNPISGAVILGAIFYNSWVYGTVCLFGTIISTLTALWLKADRELIKNGLFGFNGALVAIGLVAFSSRNFTTGDTPTLFLWLYLAFAAAFTTILVAVFAALLGPHKVAGLTMPFVLTGWMLLAAVLHFSMLEVGPSIKPTSPSDFTGSRPSYSLDTWYHGIADGIAEIFFQDNSISGLIILAGIAVNSRISALMALGGSALAAAIAMLYGAHDDVIKDGLFGYNAALTAMALGGFFLVLTVESLLYTLFGVIVTTWAWAGIATYLEPSGMPAFTGPFVLVTWLMLIGQSHFQTLIPVPPAESITPEENLRRSRVDQKR
ncbi:MAG TPA: urea transporter [Nitrospiraceae bacterium]|nr:urea transporter [Nitrospiraceae bacterium]